MTTVADHLTTAQRHTAHRAAARELAADGAPAEAVAAHLLHVEPVRDPEVASAPVLRDWSARSARSANFGTYPAQAD